MWYFLFGEQGDQFGYCMFVGESGDDFVDFVVCVVMFFECVVVGVVGWCFVVD